MRKITIAAGLSFFIMVSCHNDDQADSPILGTWKATKTMTISGGNGIILQQQQLTGCEAKTTYEYKTNGDFEYNDYCSSPFIRETGTFSYGEKSMVVTLYTFTDNGSQQSSQTLHSLTANQMQVLTNTFDYDNDGVPDLSVTVLTKI
jgi:hypothetical protein